MRIYKRLLFIINPNAGMRHRESPLTEIIMAFSGLEKGDIDEGGVIDGVLLHIGGFDTFLPPILPV